MLEAHVINYDHDDQEKVRIVIRRIGSRCRIVLEVAKPNDCSLTRLEVDGYELLRAIKAVL